MLGFVFLMIVAKLILIHNQIILFIPLTLLSFFKDEFSKYKIIKYALKLKNLTKITYFAYLSSRYIVERSILSCLAAEDVSIFSSNDIKPILNFLRYSTVSSNSFKLRPKRSSLTIQSKSFGLA